LAPLGHTGVASGLSCNLLETTHHLIAKADFTAGLVILAAMCALSGMPRVVRISLRVELRLATPDACSTASALALLVPLAVVLRTAEAGALTLTCLAVPLALALALILALAEVVISGSVGGTTAELIRALVRAVPLATLGVLAIPLTTLTTLGILVVLTAALQVVPVVVTVLALELTTLTTLVAGALVIPLRSHDVLRESYWVKVNMGYRWVY